MPHVIVKMYSGKSDKQKSAIAEGVTKAIMKATGQGEESVSVSIEDVAPKDWAEKVFRPEIIQARQSLQKARLQAPKPTLLNAEATLGTFVVGLVAGAQFAASLVSRVWSGHFADSRGAKRAVITGLLMATISGLLYLLSLRFIQTPVTSAAILLIGRALLGGAESFIITGAVSWGLTLVGPQSAGRVIAWMGMAMFAAFALGAPLGSALYASGGFAAVALATTLVPLVTVLLVAPLAPTPPRRGIGRLSSRWLGRSGCREHHRVQLADLVRSRLESGLARL